MKYLLALILLATPLSGQDRVFRVSDTTFVNIYDSTVVFVDTDNLAIAQQSLADAISALPQPAQQSTWSKVRDVVIIGMMGWGIWEFKKFVDKWEPSSVEQNNTNEDGDTNVEVSSDHGKSGKSHK